MLLLHTSCFILTIALVQSYKSNIERTRRDDGSKMLFPDDKHIYNVGEQDDAVTPSLDFFQRLNEIENVSDFMEEFVDKDSLDARTVESRMDGVSVERSAGIRPQPAGCKPDLEIVPLRPENFTNDPTIIYYPSCTRVNRCSGCCSSNLLSCQPTEIVTKTFQVSKNLYVGGKNPLKNKGFVPVIVEEHTKCRCECVVQEKDCNSLQKYNKSQCKCICNNTDDKTKCLNDDLKIWDATSCTCRCKEDTDCTTDSYFDFNRCQCVGGRSSFQSSSPSGYQQPSFDRRQLILKAIPVAQNDNTRYQLG